MSESFKPIPSVPQAIKEAVNDDSLAVFIGAGVSQIVGCDGWGDLAKKLLDKCYEKNLISYKDKEAFAEDGNHKKSITICLSLFKEESLENEFYDEMRISLKEGVKINKPNIYDEVIKLRGLFITTNADTHFDHHFITPKILYKKGDFKADSLDRTNLYHIHGSIKDHSSLIFTVSKYLERYNDGGFADFLMRIFTEYTVIFLGYGLNEFEVLDFILRGKTDIASAKLHRHFILKEYFSGQESMLSHEQAYYNELGVKVIGYNIDDRGYTHLQDVIKNWNMEINEVSSYLHDATRLIDEAVI